MGDREPVHFAAPPAMSFDPWDAKALAERAAPVAFPAAEIALQPANGEEERLWDVHVDGEVRGECAASRSTRLSGRSRLRVELVLGRCPTTTSPTGEHANNDGVPGARRPTPYRPLPSTPAAEFDLALSFRPRDGGEGRRGHPLAAGDLLERLAAFDQYEGSGVEAGHRSVAWRLTLRHPERTLRDKEIEGRRTGSYLRCRGAECQTANVLKDLRSVSSSSS
jgi:phenylalanyl-tRNA synthetase beta chain